MKTKRAHSWQLILADLSLILFLVTLTALAGEEASESTPSSPDEEPPLPDIASAQALYRPVPFGPTISDWLSEQAPDPRATLTIFASHTDNDHDAVWEVAQALAKDAQDQGFGVRVVVTKGQASDIYASLAYDNEVISN